MRTIALSFLILLAVPLSGWAEECLDQYLYCGGQHNATFTPCIDDFYKCYTKTHPPNEKRQEKIICTMNDDQLGCCDIDTLVNNKCACDHSIMTRYCLRASLEEK